MLPAQREGRHSHRPRKDPDLMTPSSCLRLLGGLALLATVLPACNKNPNSGGGSGPFKVTSGPMGAKIAGLNLPVQINFNKTVNPDTVGSASIQVVTVPDPAGLATAPPGSQASVSFTVSGMIVQIVPTVEFAPAGVEFGFLANALYEVAFTPPGGGTSVESTTGQPLNNPNQTFFFRTPDKGFDFNLGFPHAHVFLVDDADSVDFPGTLEDTDGDGSLVAEAVAFFNNPVPVVPAVPPQQVAVSPVRDVVFVFDDALSPPSAVNTVDNSSPTLRVSANTAPVPQFVPVTVPGQYAFLHQQDNLTVLRWRPGFVAWPPGGFLFVQVNSEVEDIAGNSKHSVTGSTIDDVFAVLQVASTPDPTAYHTLETFADKEHEDPTSSSAEWAGDFPGQLGPVLGGGTGADGPFQVDALGTLSNPGQTTVPLVAVINFTTKVVSLPTVRSVSGGLRVPRTWNFTSFLLPAGWTLKPLTDRNGDGTPDPVEFIVSDPGDPLDGLGAPLSVRCAGNMQIFGTVDCTGVDAKTLVRPESPADGNYAAYLGQGGVGADPLLAAGMGGHGGDVLLLKQDDTVATSLKSPQATPAYQSSDGKLTGATGRSKILTATTLFDELIDLSILNTDPGLSALLAAGEIRLQPNLGVGSSDVLNCGTKNQKIDENHPTFVVQSVAAGPAGTTFTVTTNPGDPTLTQPSKNIGAEAIAAATDCYLVGRLHGRAGTDPTPLQRGGPGAEPYVVVNEGALGITTTSGGGGGGGGISAGIAGESDGPPSNPAVNQRGTSGGLALDDSPGAPGGLGCARGIGRVMNDTEIDVQSQTGGASLAGLGGATLVGSLIIPNAANDGWMFRIASFDGTTFVVERIQLDVIDIGLTDGPGADGPGLQVGHDYDFLIVPSLDIGGAGGGGTGVSVTGTANTSFTVLPTLAPGAGGGAGGGSLLLETAHDLLLGPTSRVLARGGKGGKVSDLQTKFAGGGGGGGGNAIVRVGRTLDAFAGALVSVAGGAGGSQTGFGLGGTGGAGFIRLENFDDTLDPLVLQGVTEPPVSPVNIGRMLGLPQGVGQSLFFQSLVVNPEFTNLTVHYLADTDGNLVPENHAWSFSSSGISGGPSNHEDPPFRIVFNDVGTDNNGFLDSAAETSVFFKPSDLVSARTGLAFDAVNGVLLYSVGERATQLHRLDPATLLPVTTGAATIVLPSIPSVSENAIDLASIAVDSTGPDTEIFLLQRVERKVHVMDLETAAFLRTITLPVEVQGAMAYDSTHDVLVLANNTDGTLVTFTPRNVFAPDPVTTNYAPLAPIATFPLTHDGAALDSELTGMAYDAATTSLWCVDAMAGTLFQVSLAPGSEGSSVTGLQRFSPLTSGGQGVVPSSVAFSGTSLFLVHATDIEDCRVAAVAPASVSLAGAPLNLASFGTLLPEGANAISDGVTYLRFRIVIDGVHNDGVTQFGTVRVDDVDLTYENRPF